MIKVTHDRWKLFEFYHTTYQNRVPDWRLGQAFLNFFDKDIKDIITEEDDNTLYQATDDQAQEIINRYIEITE